MNSELGDSNDNLSWLLIAVQRIRAGLYAEGLNMVGQLKNHILRIRDEKSMLILPHLLDVELKVLAAQRVGDYRSLAGLSVLCKPSRDRAKGRRKLPVGPAISRPRRKTNLRAQHPDKGGEAGKVRIP